MAENEYEALDAGERWGCGVGFLLGALSFVLLLTAEALGDCADSSCTKGFWPNVALPTLAVTVIAFFLVRKLVNEDRK